jgi:hypothetical protein
MTRVVNRSASLLATVARTGICLLVLAVTLGHLHLEWHAHQAGQAQLDHFPRDHLQLAKSPFTGPGRGFPAFVAQHVPDQAPVRVVMPAIGPQAGPAVAPPGICGNQTSNAYFWVQYLLLPHPSVCDTGARFTLFIGVQPVSIPPGARAFVYHHGYVVVDRGGGP